MDYSHLNLTQYVIKNDTELVGEGGYSDVYRSHLPEDWSRQHLTDKIVLQLLAERGYAGLSSTPVYVVVKVLRFPNAVDPITVENVRCLSR